MVSSKEKEKGFSLLELLLVIAIILVLSALAVVVLSRQGEMAQDQADKYNIRSAYSLVRTQFANGLYPDSSVVAERVRSGGVAANEMSSAASESPSGSVGVYVDGEDKIYLRSGACLGTDSSAVFFVSC